MPLLTFDELPRVDDEEGLEYIPERPDFIDGEDFDDHPTNEVHSGELPSDQDPRDTVEEGGDEGGQCPSIGMLVEIPEIGDMTEIIERHLSADRRNAAMPQLADFLKRGYKPTPKKQKQTWPQIVDENGKSKYTTETEMALGYNVFDDPNVEKYLIERGLSQKEIKNFGDIRDYQLEQIRARGGPHKWGQGTGVYVDPSGRSSESTAPTQTQPGQQSVWTPTEEDWQNIWNPTPDTSAQQQANAWPDSMTPSTSQQNQNQRYPSNMYPGQQSVPARQPGRGKTLPRPRRPPGRGRQRGPVTKGKGGWSPGGQVTQSRSLKGLRNHVNIVGNLLAMPRTASVIRQAVDLVSAVHELDDGQSLDETTKSALRKTSRNLLTATDHLKGVKNQIANRVADEIEQLYVKALNYDR